jgi:hypothetical protein
MISVHLNNGNLIIFKTGKITFKKGKLFVNLNPTLNHNFDYEKQLKEVYKVEEWTCRNEVCIAIAQRTIYRGYLLKRGIKIQTTAECRINGTGEIEWIYY